MEKIVESCELFSKKINCDLHANASAQECKETKISLIKYCSSQECKGIYIALHVNQNEFYSVKTSAFYKRQPIATSWAQGVHQLELKIFCAYSCNSFVMSLYFVACKDLYCRNGGKCAGPNASWCACPPGYAGAFCQKSKWWLVALF